MKKKEKNKKEKNNEEEDSIKLAWMDYRKSVYETQSKSQDDFEKYINLIASGALGLTITFFDKITPIESVNFIWIIAFGWLLLAFTLLSNLYSHYISAESSEKTITYIDEENYEGITSNNEVCNRKIKMFNKLSLYSLIMGIVTIIIFVVINIYNMSDNKPKPNQQPKPLTEERERGRTLPPPPQNRPSNNPKTK